MNAQRAISIVLILTLGVSTTACSTTTSVVDLQSDPAGSQTRARFEAGEEIKISGYERVSDGHRNWKGLAQLAPPDSVQFTPTSTTPRRAFKVARLDLASIDFRGRDTYVVPARPAPDPAETAEAPVVSQQEVAPAATEMQETTEPEISVVTTSPGGMSKRSKQRALTIGIFVAVVGAIAIGYAVAGEY